MINMKRCTISFLAVITALILLVGCGGSSSASSHGAIGGYNNKMAVETAPAAPQQASRDAGLGMPEPSPLSNGTPDMAPVLSDRKIIKRNDMRLQTQDFDKSLADVLGVIVQNGGYIESQTLNGSSIHNPGEERSAHISARIPVEKLDGTSNSIAALCNVLSQSSRTEDITDIYFDSDAHLKSLTLQEERLLEILQKAEKLEDVIALEQSLSSVRYQIESLTASLRRMDSQVSYSFLDIDLHEVVTLTRQEKTFVQRLSATVERSGRNITDWFESALFYVIADAPLLVLNLIVLAIIIAIILLIVHFISKKTGRTLSLGQRNPSSRKKGQSSPNLDTTAETTGEEPKNLPPQ